MTGAARYEEEHRNMSLTYEDVDEILRLLDGAKADLTLESGDFLLEVRRGGTGNAPPVHPAGRPRAGEATPAPRSPATPSSAPGAHPARAEAEASASPEPAPADDSGANVMGAPMTGTFYRSPSPQDPPFVEEGQEVEAGATIGLIEVMKLFTTIEAPHPGRVVRILAGNAETVQADQPLFEIVPL